VAHSESPTTTPSSGVGLEASRVATAPAPTQSLSHALGGPVAPSRHMPAVFDVLGPLPKSPGHGLSGNKVPSPQRDKHTDAMEIHEVNAVRCLGQPTPVLIEMSSPRGGEGSAGGPHSHEGGLLTSGTTKKKRRSGSAKHGAGNAGGIHQASRHQSPLKYLSKQ